MAAGHQLPAFQAAYISLAILFRVAALTGSKKYNYGDRHSIFNFDSSLITRINRRLQSLLKTKEIGRKEYILRAGQVCRNVYFIQKGLLRCFYHKDDQEVCSWFMKEGDIIISVESFYQQKSSYESIQALEDCLLHYLDYRELQQLYKTFPELNYAGRVLTEKYYCLSEQRLYSMRMQRSQERYEHLLEHHPELVLRVPAKYLGSYLGITESHFSHIRSKR